MKEKIVQIITSIQPDFLWGFLAFVLFIFLIIALILQYHWKHYGIEGSGKIFAKSIFWIVSIFLILIATFALVAFEA